MARIDIHRLENLRRDFATIETIWPTIGCSKSTFLRYGEEKSLRWAKDGASRDVQRLFWGGGAFAVWSEKVVDAFGIDVFPTYEPKPPKFHGVDEASASRQRSLTRFDDPVQSGLQIIFWAAASQKPKLVLEGDSDWSPIFIFRSGIKEWAAHLIIERNEVFAADPAPMEWVHAAFDHLQKTVFKGRRQGQPRSGSGSEYQLASKLQQLHSDKFASYKLFKKFLDEHSEIRTQKPSDQRLLVHVGDLALVLVKRNDDLETQMSDAKTLTRAIVGHIDKRKQLLHEKKSSGK